MKDLRKYMSPDRMKKIVVIAVIFATLIFIFARSAKSPEQSTAESDKVADIVATIIPPTTETGLFINENIRKIAHFLEYGLLGMECAFYVLFFEKDKRRGAALMGAFGFASAFLDETIQIFSNRGPAISDVWLDLSGFATLSLLTFVGPAIYSLVKRTEKTNATKTES